LLHSSLKHSKFDCSDKEQLQMLDPFVELLATTLANSAHSKVLCRTLHCLIWLLRLPLGSIPRHLDSIVEDIFRLIRRHARMGMAMGANKELVLSSFKVRIISLVGGFGYSLYCDKTSQDEFDSSSLVYVFTDSTSIVFFKLPNCPKSWQTLLGAVCLVLVQFLMLGTRVIPGRGCVT